MILTDRNTVTYKGWLIIVAEFQKCLYNTFAESNFKESTLCISDNNLYANKNDAIEAMKDAIEENIETANESC